MQGERLYTPHPIRDALPPEQQAAWKPYMPTSRRLRHCRATRPELAMKNVLDSCADLLAARIDLGEAGTLLSNPLHGQQSDPQPRTQPSGPRINQRHGVLLLIWRHNGERRVPLLRSPPQRQRPPGGSTQKRPICTRTAHESDVSTTSAESAIRRHGRLEVRVRLGDRAGRRPARETRYGAGPRCPTRPAATDRSGCSARLVGLHQHSVVPMSVWPNFAGC
jgi:hypothetical protein